MLTWCIFLPLITAAILILIPSGWKGLIKSVSVIGALLTFIVSVNLYTDYKNDDGVIKGDARTKLAEVQAEILLEIEWTVDSQGDEFRKVAFPSEGSKSFSPAAYETAKLAVRKLAASEEAQADAERAWKQALELEYAMVADATKHLGYTEWAPWIELFNVNYFIAVDGLSLPLIWLTALLSLLCLVYSWNTEKGTKGYYILFLLLETGLLGVFCALDFFLFYVFWEIVLLPMYFLIGVWGGENRLYAAIKFFIYTLVGSVIMLICMLVLYYGSEPNTFNLLALMTVVPGGEWFPSGLQWWLFLGLFVGFAIKVPVFPFHTWLPDAHVEAPTAVSVMLAGILLKMGGYGLFRISYPMLPDAAASNFFIALLAVLGMINIIYGAFCALAQKDFKRLVAYSSVSHMGFVLLGLAAMTYYGVNGAALQMFNHGVSSAMMFFLVGVIYDRAHHRDLTRFGGIGLQMPWYTGLATLGFFASLGLPGLNGFVSEFLCFVGAWGGNDQVSLVAGTVGAHGIGSRWIVVVSLLGVILTACYILWTIQRVFLGKIRNEEYKKFPDLSFREVFALAPLGALCVLLGVWPKILIDFMDGTLTTMTDMVRNVLLP